MYFSDAEMCIQLTFECYLERKNLKLLETLLYPIMKYEMHATDAIKHG